jgi:murein DD-endopeptidase MepM/ murein hydrolase activator NlpD
MKLALIKSCGLAAAASILWISLIAQAGAVEPDTAVLSPAFILSTPEVTNGNPLLLQIDTRSLDPPISALKINFQKRDYPVYRHPVNPSDFRFGLIAIPYRQTPGPARLTLTWTNAAGQHLHKIPFKIVAGNYPTDELKVEPGRVNPSKKNSDRARKEARRVRQIYAGGNITALWAGDFQLPMDSKITSSFGNKRLFNGQLKSYHNGVDFRASVGTPVLAANSGVVKLADNLFYSGNTVIIDHGNLIFTIYAHLSKLEVKTGQPIAKGQPIGLTGATGRVSGPHLHWGVKVNGSAVNPIEFVEVMASLVKEQR